MNEAYSYRANPAVPPFDDRRSLFVFDGFCVLCSGGAAWLMRHDRERHVRFVSAQSAIGTALYAHYGLPLDESYLLVEAGRLYTKTDGYIRLFALLGGFWNILRMAALVPQPIRDWFYDRIAANRYRWFGRTREQCELLSPEQRQRLARSLEHWAPGDEAA